MTTTAYLEQPTTESVIIEETQERFKRALDVDEIDFERIDHGDCVNDYFLAACNLTIAIAPRFSTA